LQSRGRDGIFWHYIAEVKPKNVALHWSKVGNGAQSQPPGKGEHNALAPNHAQFDRAASWSVELPESALTDLSDLFLRIEYTGDVARLYCNDKLLDDDFFKGTVWEIGLKRFSADCRQKLVVKITPLRKDAPLYIPHSAWPAFSDRAEIAEIRDVSLSPEYETVVVLARDAKLERPSK